MTVVLNRHDESLRLSEEAWTAALVASLAHGWQRQDAGRLTFRDLALLLPDPEYEAERRKEGGYPVSAGDAAQLALAMLRAWPELLQQPDPARASGAGQPTPDVHRQGLRELCSFCQKGAFTFSVEPASSVAGEGEAGGGATSAPAGADREAAPASDDRDAEEHVEPPADQPPETSADGGSDIGVDGHDGAGDQGRSPYEPSREELLILVRHWFGCFLDIRLFQFFCAPTGGSDRRAKLEAISNLERLTQALGPEAVEAVVREVEEEARRRMGEEDWRAFTAGTREEQQRAQDETQAAQDYLDRKRRDRETRRRALACLRRDPWGVYRDADGDLWTWGEVYRGGRRPKRPRLLLVVTTRQDWRGVVPGGTLKRPPGWYAPFGLGRVGK